MNRRTELKIAYKESWIPKGVFQIKNKVNGKVYVDSSLNLKGALNRHRLMLKIGSHQNIMLQQEWNEFGEENFSFIICEELEQNDDHSYNYKEDLKLLVEIWLDKLQPYGEKGYHKKG